MARELRGFLYIRERKECRNCYYFSPRLAWWHWLMIPVAYRKLVVGRCIRPRWNWNEYAIVESKEKTHCNYYSEGK